MSSPAPGIRSKLKVRKMEKIAPISPVPVSRKASFSISFAWNSHVAIPSSEGGWKRKYLTFLVYSEAGQWRKTLSIALIKQKRRSPPFLDSLGWSIPLNVSLKYSWFGLMMCSSNFHLTFSNSHGKAGSLEKTVHSRWNRGPSSQCWDTGNSLEPCSMDDGDQWQWWWW